MDCSDEGGLVRALEGASGKRCQPIVNVDYLKAPGKGPKFLGFFLQAQVGFPSYGVDISLLPYRLYAVNLYPFYYFKWFPSSPGRSQEEEVNPFADQSGAQFRNMLPKPSHYVWRVFPRNHEDTHLRPPLGLKACQCS
jgi:hypothetical protein